MLLLENHSWKAGENMVSVHSLDRIRHNSLPPSLFERISFSHSQKVHEESLDRKQGNT